MALGVRLGVTSNLKSEDLDFNCFTCCLGMTGALGRIGLGKAWV